MKTFKEYISEAFSLAPVVDLTTNGTDVKIQEVKNQLNRNIDLTLRQNFQTVDEALSKLSKILAMYNLDIPRVEFGDLKQNSLNGLIFICLRFLRELFLYLYRKP